MSIQPVALGACMFFVVEAEDCAVSIHWIRRGSKDALGAAVNPNYEARFVRHCCTHGQGSEFKETGPARSAGGRPLRSTMNCLIRFASLG